jgi:hypothetical protein
MKSLALLFAARCRKTMLQTLFRPLIQIMAVPSLELFMAIAARAGIEIAGLEFPLLRNRGMPRGAPPSA